MMLTCTGIQAAYATATILRGIDLTVDEGEVVGMLGRNGMGKTTLIRCIAGLAPPQQTGGTITLAGDDLTGQPSHRIAQQGIGLVPQGRHIFGSLTVEENLTVAARPGLDGQDWTLDRVYEFFPRLRERRNSRGQTLSGGEQQMLAIGRALMTNPRLLLLDEATEGLAPLIRQKIWAALARIRDNGVSILVVDKNVADLIRLANRHVIIEKGRVVWQGTSPELAAQEDIQHRYLGV
jgi:branched-chain amino acid transport system ATP-binding protein